MRGPSSPAQAPTILVIEDEAIVREVVQKTLEQNGYRVLVAGGGNEALDLCESSATPIDLVLTDIVMPGTSGADLAGYLASRYSSSQVDHRKVGKLALAIQVVFQELGAFAASGTAVPLQTDGSLTRGGAPGKVYIATAGWHMTVAASGPAYRTQLSKLPAGTLHTPSADVLMHSVADVFGNRGMGVIPDGYGC